VASASTIWPTHFSALFEAYRVDGPVLPQNDVILAINSCGVFLLDSHYDVIVGFHFYDVINLKADNRCPVMLIVQCSLSAAGLADDAVLYRQ